MQDGASGIFTRRRPRVPRARSVRRAIARVAVAASAVLVTTGGSGHAAHKVQLIHTFGDQRGAIPQAGLIADGAGNLYGTTGSGGKHGHGVVFALSPPAVGKRLWTETILHAFQGNDGEGPLSGLVQDATGNLYGTTVGGGKHDDGVVFKLSPPAVGSSHWTETVLVDLPNPKKKGAFLSAALVLDGAGNLYGTSLVGGIADKGLVFEVSPPAPGQTKWTETALHIFAGPDGAGPDGPLIMDGSGNLYGATMSGGASNDGVVFELSPPPPGQSTWTETVLHAFDGADGNGLNGQNVGVIRDAAGNLYGTTGAGGPSDTGCVYELSPPPPGQSTWTETVIYAFPFRPRKLRPISPNSTLVVDPAGNLYGTTGAYDENGEQNSGYIFELSPPGLGQTQWTRTSLHRLGGTTGDSPSGGLLLDAAGDLFGTTESGGKMGVGTVFKVTP